MSPRIEKLCVAFDWPAHIHAFSQRQNTGSGQQSISASAQISVLFLSNHGLF